MELLVEKTKDHLKQNLPVVLYYKPNSDEIISFFQKNDTLFDAIDFNEKGFLFASFDGTKTFLIPENESEIINRFLSFFISFYKLYHGN